MKNLKPKKKVKNPWLLHLEKFSKAHPKMTYRDAMKAAAKTYKPIR